MRQDRISGLQYLAMCFVALFSPISRLLPKAVLELAGISGIVSPLLAALPLFALIWLMHRLLTPGGKQLGLADAFCEALGPAAGKAVTLFYGLWVLFYGGFLLRSGGERLISTIYPNANLTFFLVVMLALTTMAAVGPLRYAARSAAVIMLLFVIALALIYLLALPNVQPAFIWPIDVTKPGRLLLSSLPVLNVLSPWTYFSFLRGKVEAGERLLRRGFRGMAVVLGIVFLLLLTTIGVLGPELSLRQQFPFFVMVKNLTLFHVIERIEPVIVMVWLMTDYVCIALTLMASSAALTAVFPGQRQRYALFCAAVMLAVSITIAPNAFSFVKMSNLVVPIANFSLVYVGFPLILLVSVLRKKLKKNKNNA